MKPAVIFDRDGVINDHRQYVNLPADFILFEDAAPAIRRLNELGFLVLVATNQGGVGLGYMSLESLLAIHAYMQRKLSELGANIDDIAFCPHVPHAGCACRKPKPGLLLELQKRNHFDLRHSYMVGDRETDVQAGQAAGTKTVLIGHGPSAATYVASGISDAVDWIIKDAARL